MAIGELPNDDTTRAGSPGNRASSAGKRNDRRYNVVVALNYEQMAAAEGWRSAHGIDDQAEALGELIRLGLLSEVAKIYRLVCASRGPEPRIQASDS